MPVWLMFIPFVAILQGLMVLLVALGQWMTGTYYALAPDDGARGGRVEIVRAAQAGKPTVNEEWLTFAADGHRELVETIKTPIYHADGTLMGVLGVARDITAKRAAEDAYRDSQTLMAAIVTQAADDRRDRPDTWPRRLTAPCHSLATPRPSTSLWAWTAFRAAWTPTPSAPPCKPYSPATPSF
jgi:hypothetical protein